jgi:hypothetical protein
MSNAKHIHVTGRLPFDCIDGDPLTGERSMANDALRDWFARMNTPTFGVKIHWTGPVESRPNKYGGKTAIYAFTIDGFEAVSYPALDELLAAIVGCGGEVYRHEIYEPGGSLYRPV